MFKATGENSRLKKVSGGPAILMPLITTINALVDFCTRNRVTAGQGLAENQTQQGKQVGLTDNFYRLLTSLEQDANNTDPNGPGVVPDVPPVDPLGLPPVTATHQLTIAEDGSWVDEDGHVADWIEADFCDNGVEKKIRMLAVIYTP